MKLASSGLKSKRRQISFAHLAPAASCVEGLFYVARTYLARANYAEAIGWGRRAVEAAPWLEEAYQLIIRGYAWQGQRSLALRVYEETVANLRQELDIAPSEKTTWLAECLREGQPI
ncbi:MAG: hypothetical protein GY805_01265 [Chloroflexi bacterium]|nr:hypothetical protein [Chloroflexota bacterium]